ncbi:hypothetical protein ADUPG1_011538 [Aduncisulcus paluster]|uniref:Uncharacterized protein n=1 Tax=Aduncisulcus paluster TaxID=2918883 RepID=A0ABQ5JWA9_9EUKA|nr:hypothetical protein ADUPG1_011538 [Aduncisulcus paluster]
MIKSYRKEKIADLCGKSTPRILACFTSFSSTSAFMSNQSFFILCFKCLCLFGENIPLNDRKQSSDARWELRNLDPNDAQMEWCMHHGASSGYYAKYIRNCSFPYESWNDLEVEIEKEQTIAQKKLIELCSCLIKLVRPKKKVGINRIFGESDSIYDSILEISNTYIQKLRTLSSSNNGRNEHYLCKIAPIIRQTQKCSKKYQKRIGDFETNLSLHFGFAHKQLRKLVCYIPIVLLIPFFEVLPSPRDGYCCATHLSVVMAVKNRVYKGDPIAYFNIVSGNRINIDFIKQRGKLCQISDSMTVKQSEMEPRKYFSPSYLLVSMTVRDERVLRQSLYDLIERTSAGVELLFNEKPYNISGAEVAHLDPHKTWEFDLDSHIFTTLQWTSMLKSRI